jgi:hypothetical protein
VTRATFLAATPELEAALHLSGFVTAAEARAIGVSRAELDRWCREGALERVLHGVYAAPLVRPRRWDVYRRFVEAVVRVHDRQIVPAGPAAAVLHGLPLIGRPPQVVHVVGRPSGGRKAGRLIEPIGPHGDREVSTRGTSTLAAPARAALDSARLLGTAAGVAAADAAWRAGLTNGDELSDACAGLAGRTGVERARRAVRLASPRSESPGESWSAVVIDSLGLPAPERQHDHADSEGFIGRSDFWWPDHRVAGEFDGRVKYGRDNPSGRPAEEVLWDEKRREDRLRRAGRTVARWTVAELLDPPRLARALAPLL